MFTEKHDEEMMGGKTELLILTKNESGFIVEPMFINLGKVSDEYIANQLAPFWFHQVTHGDGTPLECAKDNAFNNLTLNKLTESESSAKVGEDMQFCYPSDPPSAPLFAVAQNGGLTVIYAYDIVWFKEPNGDEFWTRMY